MSRGSKALESATYDHVALSVTDLDNEIAFYEALGFHVTSRTELQPARLDLVVMRNAQDVGLELVWNERSADPPRPNVVGATERKGLAHFAWRVRDVEAAVDLVTSVGGSAVLTPRRSDISGVVYAYVADPEGNLVELVSRSV